MDLWGVIQAKRIRQGTIIIQPVENNSEELASNKSVIAVAALTHTDEITNE